MRAFLRYALLMANLVIHRKDDVIVLSKVKRVVRVMKLLEFKKLVKNLNQVPTMGLGC